MEAHGKIDEADVGQLKVGQMVLFTVDAFPDRTFSGQVLHSAIIFAAMLPAILASRIQRTC
jgi:hypothetical protein